MNWHTVFNAISAFGERHYESLDLLGIAAIMNLPPLKNALYMWFRSTLQSWIGRAHPDQAQGTRETIPPPTDQHIRNPFKPASVVPQPEPPKES